MSRIEFHVWLPEGDLTAAADAIFSTDDQLVDAGFNAVTYGEGDGFLEIHADHADTQYLQRRGTVRAVDTQTGVGLFWWILEEATVKLVSKKEEAGRTIEWTGRGALILWDRYRLGEAIFAPGAVARGDISIPDYWTWQNKSLAAILKRVWEEGQNHSMANFYPDLFVDWTRTADSAGNAWTEIATDYQVKIGTSGMQVAADFLKQGGFLAIDRFSLPVVVQAYEDVADFRTDRSSATFAIDKVRFEAGVNIATELPLKVAASRERSHNLTRRRDGVYATKSGNGSGVPYMDFQDLFWTLDPDTVTQASNWNLYQRQKQSTLAVVQHKYGPGGLSGADGYAPGEHYWLGDLVTVHTGTGEYDLNEQTLEIAGIRVFLRDSEWMAEVQLGARIINAKGQPAALPGGGGGTTVVNPVPVQLCQPEASGGAFSDGGEVGQDADTSTNDRASGYWPGYFEEGVEITAPADIEAGTTLIAVVAWNRDSALGNDLRDSQCYDEQGNEWILDAESDPVGSSDRIVQIWRCNVTTTIPTGDYIRWGAQGTTVEQDATEFAAGRAFGVYYFNGTLDNPNVGATAGTFGSTMTVAAPAGDVVIGGICRHDSSVTGDGDWNALVPWTETGSGAGIEYTSVFGQWKENVTSENWVCTSGANKDWSGIAVGYDADAPFTVPGDGPEELVGTSVKAARCDHNHLLEALRTEETDTSLVPHPDGAGGVEWGTDATGSGSGSLVLEGVYEHSTTQSIGSGADTAVQFNTDVSDTGAMHDPSSNNSRIVVQTAQADLSIRIKANISIPAVSTQWQGWIKKNGTTDQRRRVRALGGTGGISTLQIDETFEPADHVAGDYYEIMVRQASGSNQNIGSATSDARNIVQVTTQ